MRLLSLLRSMLALRHNVPSALALLRDARVPSRLKLVAAAGALFIVSPLNILGDIPLLGFFDDAALIAMLLGWFVRTAGPYADDGRGQTIATTR